MAFEIRAIQRHDLPALARAHALAYSEEKTGERWTDNTSLKRLEYHFDRSPEGCRWMAVHEGTPTGGFLADIKPWWDGPRLCNGELFVHPQYQRQGVGRALFQQMLLEARARYGVAQYDLVSFAPADQHPLRWYLEMGFETNDQLVLASGNVDKILKHLKGPLRAGSQ